MSTIKSRHLWILYILLLVAVLPIHGQDASGSDIVSRTFLSADETKAIEQRVYDNFHRWFLVTFSFHGCCCFK
jgi:hypothetical protein